MSSIFDSPEFNDNLFFPRPDYDRVPPNCEDFMVKVDSGVEIHLRRHLAPSGRFSLLYFHGNGEVVADYDGLANRFSEIGAELIVADYRGYGKSSGQPTLRSALKDSVSIFDFLKERNIFQEKICVMGRSLGSASAIELVLKRSGISACIIESGYADPIPLVERRGLRIEATTAEEDALFNNSVKIRNIKCPLFIMHGKMDSLISPKEALLNYRQSGSEKKELELFEGVGHNDILMADGDGYFIRLSKFLENTVGI